MVACSIHFASLSCSALTNASDSYPPTTCLCRSSCDRLVETVDDLVVRVKIAGRSRRGAVHEPVLPISVCRSVVAPVLNVPQKNLRRGKCQQQSVAYELPRDGPYWRYTNADRVTRSWSVILVAGAQHRAQQADVAPVPEVPCTRRAERPLPPTHTACSRAPPPHRLRSTESSGARQERVRSCPTAAPGSKWWRPAETLGHASLS